ncbi:MAG: hypothetical protein WED00_08880 [Aquisalimonadaceae bacterium]
MLVKFIGNRFSPDLASVGFTAETRLDLTEEREYEVYAVAEWPESNYCCVISDVDMPLWAPVGVFTTLRDNIPDNWILAKLGTDLKFIQGPEFIARDEDAYSALVSLEPDAVDRFWQHIEEIGK